MFILSLKKRFKKEMQRYDILEKTGKESRD